MRLVAFAAERLGGLDVLVNNAGVYGPKGPIEDVEWDEWRRAVEINLFGSVLPVRAALPHLQALRARQDRPALRRRGDRAAAVLSAYAASKAASCASWRRWRARSPSTASTSTRSRPERSTRGCSTKCWTAGPERVGEEFYAKALAQRENGGAPLEGGAALAVFLGSRASDGITGRLHQRGLGSVGDARAAARRPRGSDVYTLRRIVPAERGFAWGERG